MAAAFRAVTSAGGPAWLFVADRRFFRMNPGLLEFFSHVGKDGCIDFLFWGQLFFAASAAAVEGKAREQAHPGAAGYPNEML